MFAVLYGVLLLLAASALALLVTRARELCWHAPVDGPAFSKALRAHRDDANALTALAAALEPAWGARLIRVVLQARADHESTPAALDELLGDLEAHAYRSLPTLHTLGRAAPPLAFVSAILELGLAFRHEAGLLSLQKGLAESIAISHAALAILTGMTVAVVCRFGVELLKRAGKRLMADLRRAAELLAANDSSQ